MGGVIAKSSAHNQQTVSRDSPIVISGLVPGTDRGRVLMFVPGTSPGMMIEYVTIQRFRTPLILCEHPRENTDILDALQSFQHLQRRRNVRRRDRPHSVACIVLKFGAQQRSG
jgi:hypothetical protein